MLERSKNPNKYIGLLGLTGSGKSTLANRLKRLGFLHLEEPFKVNPFLEAFYASEMKDYAYKSQEFFLESKCALTKIVKLALGFFPVAVDPSRYLDIYMYAEVLWRIGSFSKEEYKKYHRKAKNLFGGFPVPDLLTYCKVSSKTAFFWVQKRDRAIEKAITLSYLELQKKCLEEWLAECQIPVLTLDFDELNITTEEGTQIALEKIRSALKLTQKS